MKEAVIRKIDELGRIVIPREIRQALKIEEGDNISIEKVENTVILKKVGISL